MDPRFRGGDNLGRRVIPAKAGIHGGSVEPTLDACPERESRFFAEFTLSRARSFAALRMTGEGVRVTLLEGLVARRVVL